jgi:hypothetical protein
MDNAKVCDGWILRPDSREGRENDRESSDAAWFYEAAAIDHSSIWLGEYWQVW